MSTAAPWTGLTHREMNDLYPSVSNPAWDNRTVPPGAHAYTTASPQYWHLLLGLLSLAGVTGNLMVIIAVAKIKRLKSNTNLVLSSLACADLMVSLLVMPPAMLQMISGSWPLGYATCSLHIFLDVCLCTSSILHMCCVSLDRYLGIAYPLKLAQLRTRAAAWWKLGIVWALSVLIACPVLIYAVVDSQTIQVGISCGMNNLAFQVYGSLCAFYIPLILMAVTYYLTVRILHGTQSNKYRPTGLRRARGCSIKSQTMDESTTIFLPDPTSNHSNQANNSGARHETYDTGLANRCGDDCLQFSTDNNNGNASGVETQLVSTRKKFVGHKLGNTHSCALAITYSKTNMTMRNGSIPNDGQSRQRSSSEGLSVSFKRRLPITERMGEWRKKNALARQVDREKKASQVNQFLVELVTCLWSTLHVMRGASCGCALFQVLGLVFLAFVMSWTPFFILNMIIPLCGSACMVSDLVINLTVWLGYSASIINPLIYTIINKQFQRAFMDMLTCELWRKRHRRKRRFLTVYSGISRFNNVLAVSTALAAGDLPASTADPRPHRSEESPFKFSH